MKRVFRELLEAVIDQRRLYKVTCFVPLFPLFYMRLMKYTMRIYASDYPDCLIYTHGSFRLWLVFSDIEWDQAPFHPSCSTVPSMARQIEMWTRLCENRLVFILGSMLKSNLFPGIHDQRRLHLQTRHWALIWWALWKSLSRFSEQLWSVWSYRNGGHCYGSALEKYPRPS